MYLRSYGETEEGMHELRALHVNLPKDGRGNVYVLG
jgi:hypothetical protein